MNSYQLEDLEIGLQQSFEFIITEKKMRAFCELCGDENPLHTEDTYARSKGYESRVVYGMLTCSFISTMVGMYLPGRYGVLQSVECKFLRPVYIQEVLTITATVESVSQSVGQIILDIIIENQDKKKVVKSKVKALVV